MTGPISYWHDSLEPGDTLEPRARLPGDRQADVAIVGAGFAGLWTAYYLLTAKPSLKVMVIEAETAGFGASGRNGGWCVPETGTALDVLDAEGGPGTGAAMMREMHRTVDVVGEVARREGIDCGFAKGGAIWFASDPTQLRRMQRRYEMLARHGLGDAYRLEGPAETTARMNATGVHGSIYTPHSAALHPARLARGLARAVERLGGTVHEMTPATRIDGRRVTTAHGVVTADVVVRATEAYTKSLAGHPRTLAPLGNIVIATEPIPDDLWAQMGLSNRETFEDSPSLLAYGQRTADNRIVWGGLGAWYYWGSNPPPTPMRSAGDAERLRVRLVERFPMLKGVAVTHNWGGVMGMTRDMRSTVGFDRETGEAWTTGFGGAGVAPTNAAGRTLADLITGTESDLTRLPWVNHRCGPWEPEPLRWLGVTSMLTRLKVGDQRAPIPLMTGELERAAKDRGIRHFLISFTDLFGVQRAKLVPTAALGEVTRAGAAFGGFATWLDMGPADTDMAARPDPTTLIQLPWKPEVGWVVADLWIGEEPVAQSPRQVLRRVIAEAATAGLTMKSGVECEFFLITPDGSSIADPADSQAKACYDQQALMRRYDIIAEISEAMVTLGWGPYQSDHEDAHGQFEMNWAYDDALVTADRHAFFKFMAKSVAEKHGLRATFMPRPFPGVVPNGCHAHLSLWRDGVNLFRDEAGDLGLSPLAYHFLGGILAHAQAFAALTNPTVNSYKRINAPVAPTGAPIGPAANAITYGGANRTHLLRIPGPDRFEVRIGDGAANPYLMQAAYLAAGLDGIATKADPGPRLDIDMFVDGQKLPGLRRLPTNLLDALRAFDQSAMLREKLGSDFVSAYVKLKTQEWDAYSAALSDWERANTLDC